MKLVFFSKDNISKDEYKYNDNENNYLNLILPGDDSIEMSLPIYKSLEEAIYWNLKIIYLLNQKKNFRKRHKLNEFLHLKK